MERGGIRNKGAEKVFLISSTHGGETHAIAAALATLDEFKNNDVIAHNHGIGDLLIQLGTELIRKHSLEQYIKVTPCNWMVVFSFLNKNKEACQGMRTLVMQEMIKRSVLFPGAFIPCYSHTVNDIYYIIGALDDVFQIYSKALNEGYEKYLIGEPAKPVFRKFL
jgi:adenosylmethionine-8-amino-7-oxononanoate aminotransferase